MLPNNKDKKDKKDKVRLDKSYTEDFHYTSCKNPYHDKLEAFGEFVFRDHEAEEKRGLWNKEVFKKEAPLILEIGAGYGHFMMDYTEKNPEINYVGLDYRFKRSFALAKKLDHHPTKSFRYLRAKGERVEFIFDKSELDKIFYFFPDPWPKARHHKKRLFQERFLKSAYEVLKPSGEIYIKTDHDGYAEWIYEEIKKSDLFELTFKTFDLYKDFPEHFLSNFQTKFEKIFLKKGVLIKAFVIKSKKDNNV